MGTSWRPLAFWMKVLFPEPVVPMTANITASCATLFTMSGNASLDEPAVSTIVADIKMNLAEIT